MTFKLKTEFVESYKDLTPPFGFRDEAGTSLGEVTYLRTYANIKSDGTKERWHECCERVVNGTYEVQRRHCVSQGFEWNEQKAQDSAQEMFDHMFNMRFLPPGRGLWRMGTEFVMERGNGAAVQNCAFRSTNDLAEDPTAAFTFTMEAAMLGVGVGFDTRGAGQPMEIEPEDCPPSATYLIPDTREGWCEALERTIKRAVAGRDRAALDPSLVRPKGAPIKGFGGKASGPEPLLALCQKVDELIREHMKASQVWSETLIVDIMNLIGKAIVAGNVRRVALIALGDNKSAEFSNLKNPEINPDRMALGTGWGHLSNNSVIVSGKAPTKQHIDNILRNGEPGFFFIDNARLNGRMNGSDDALGVVRSDHRIMGLNPCSEQMLESGELCTLVDVFPTNCKGKAQYMRMLKFAYLYAKSITLLSTPWEASNAIMKRNRRIGVGMSGITDLIDSKGLAETIEWMEDGYAYIRQLDEVYSEWLGVRESIRVTTVKPSGTVSLLAGVSPGVHWSAGAGSYFRLVTISKNEEPLLRCLREAGYRIEDYAYSPTDTSVVYFPIVSKQKRSEREVSLWEKFTVASLAQRHWSDNGVSVTLTFDRDSEAEHISHIIDVARTQSKAISFLPMGNDVYVQMPYTSATRSEVRDMAASMLPADLSYAYSDGIDAIGESGCTTDACDVRALTQQAGDLS